MWLDWERSGDAQISPDGELVVYERRRIDKYKDAWQTELWIIDKAGEAHQFLAAGHSPRWSPDGARIAYIANDADDRPQVFIRSLERIGLSTQVTRINYAPTLLRWSPDGRTIAFRARVPQQAGSDWPLDIGRVPNGAGWEDPPVVATTLNFHLNECAAVEGYGHLFVVPAESGTARQLTSGAWHTSAILGGLLLSYPFSWTPDGAWLVFDGTGPDGNDNELENKSLIHKVNVATRELQTLTTTRGQWFSPAVSPDGKSVAFYGKQYTQSTYGANEVRVVGMNGSDERIVTDDLPSGVFHFAFAKRNDVVYLNLDARGHRNLYRLSLDGQLRPVTEGRHRLTVSQVTPSGQFAGRVSEPHKDWDVAIGNVRTGETARLTALNEDVLSDVLLAPIEEIWAGSSEDTRVQGWLLSPPDFDASRRYPLLLYIHGGPHAMYGVDFQFVMQAMAAKGYFVLYSNPRGSTGYGWRFANAVDNQYPGRRDLDDLNAIINLVARRDSIDPSRLYVAGCSGGGVLTTWMVAHSNRFAAAASLCTVSNWISFSGTADSVSGAYNFFHKPWWEDTDRWLRHSPLMRAPDVRTPTIFVTGENDRVTPVSQAQEFYSALKMIGTPTKLVIMKGEGHGTTSKPSNMLRTIAVLHQWFDEWHAPTE